MTSPIDDLRRTFHDRLKSGDAEAWHQVIQKQATERGVIYGERTVCRVLEPLFISRSQYQLILSRAELCVSALKKVAALARQDPQVWARLKFTRDEEELLSIPGGYGQHDQIARLDSFLNEAGDPVFLEYNGESPGGIAYGDSLGQIFDGLAPIQELAEAYPMSRRPVTIEVVRTLRKTYYEWAARQGVGARTEPQVAIIDLADMPTIGEFEIFRKLFESTGMPCRIASPDQLRFDDGEVYVGDFRVDIIYRRLLTADLLKNFASDHPLVRVMRENLAFVANGFGGYLLSHKGLFALLSDPNITAQVLTDEEIEAVRISIPWTRMVEETETKSPIDGAMKPLRQIAMEHQEQLVIKGALGYGGQNVCLGWTVSAEEWQQVFEAGLQSPHVIQKRLFIPTMEYPAWVDGSLKFLPLHFDIDPYILDGRRAHGLGIRLAADDMLNVATGAGSAVPAYIVEDR
ncbi:MAG: putative circularly permuted ATP-grasp superfamily protein [Planctomycetota bacterium]|jgi:uncharacterized circularly permuted ATP-grasp superfamily protein